MRRTLFLLSVLILAGVAGLGWWNASGPEPYQAATVFGNQARPLPAFSLTRHDGEALEMADFQGRWSLLFFGYSHCPDICSPTLQRLTVALRALDDTRGQIVFVSVDPERDVPQVLQRYVKHFHPRTLGVTGEAEAVADFSGQIGAFHARRKLATGYLVDHGASVWLVDPEARLAGIFTPPLVPAEIAEDLRKLIDSG